MHFGLGTLFPRHESKKKIIRVNGFHAENPFSAKVKGVQVYSVLYFFWEEIWNVTLFGNSVNLADLPSDTRRNENLIREKLAGIVKRYSCKWLKFVKTLRHRITLIRYFHKHRQYDWSLNWKKLFLLRNNFQDYQLGNTNAISLFDSFARKLQQKSSSVAVSKFIVGQTCAASLCVPPGCNCDIFPSLTELISVAMSLLRR